MVITSEFEDGEGGRVLILKSSAEFGSRNAYWQLAVGDHGNLFWSNMHMCHYTLR